MAFYMKKTTFFYETSWLSQGNLVFSYVCFTYSVFHSIFFHKGVDQFFIFGGGMQKEGGGISKGAEPTEGDTIMFNGNNNISNSVFALHSFFVTCY